MRLKLLACQFWLTEEIHQPRPDEKPHFPQHPWGLALVLLNKRKQVKPAHLVPVPRTESSIQHEEPIDLSLEPTLHSPEPVRPSRPPRQNKGKQPTTELSNKRKQIKSENAPT